MDAGSPVEGLIRCTWSEGGRGGYSRDSKVRTPNLDSEATGAVFSLGLGLCLRGSGVMGLVQYASANSGQ